MSASANQRICSPSDSPRYVRILSGLIVFGVNTSLKPPNEDSRRRGPLGSLLAALVGSAAGDLTGSILGPLGISIVGSAIAAWSSLT